MSMGGSSSAPTESTVVQSNLPKYAKPYYKRMMSRAEDLSLRDYTPYRGQRLAKPARDTRAAYNLTRNIAKSGIPGMGDAMNATYQAMNAGQQLAQGAQPYEFTGMQADPYAGFDANMMRGYGGFDATMMRGYGGFDANMMRGYGGFQESDANAFAYDPARQFNNYEAASYMSPYVQQVMDVQKEQAQLDYDRSRAARSSRAVEAGAFGGSRAAVQESLAESDMLDRMARIEAEGMQGAYESAGQMFQADRAAQFQQQQAQIEELARAQGISVEEAARVQAGMSEDQYRVQAANQAELARVQAGMSEDQYRVQAANQAELARVQAGMSEDRYRVQAANQAELARVQEQQAEELARVQGISVEEAARIQQAQADENYRSWGQGMEALQYSTDMAQQLASLGEAARAGDVQAAQMLESIGTSQQGMTQAGLDLAYQDFLTQRDYPLQNLNYMSSIMQGVPITPNTTTTSFQPYNPYQQLLGAGLGTIGLFKGLQA